MVRSVSMSWVLGLAAFGMLHVGHEVSAQVTNFSRFNVEWSTDVLGPWTDVPGQNREISENGEILISSDAPQRFVRLGGSFMQGGLSNTGSRVPLSQAPSSTVARAEKFMRDWQGTPDPDNITPDADGESWAHARLSPYAIKVYDPTYRGGLEPAYLEFKVVADPDATNLMTYVFGREGVVAPENDLGFILVSLHEGDYPQPTFAQRGKTPYENLLARVPSSANPRIMRYGDGFSAVEGGDGSLLVSFGSAPFRINREALGLVGQTFAGEFDSDIATTNLLEGQGGPSLGVGFYADYGEFKRDYQTNEIYRVMRDARAKSAAVEWAIEKEVPAPVPEVWIVNVRETIVKLDGETVTRVFLDDDTNESNAKIATFTFGGDRAGIQITGMVTGSAPVTVQTGGGVTNYYLTVIDGSGSGRPAGGPVTKAFTPGWQPWKTWYASPDGYGGMAKYYQAEYYDWCDLPGCGPVAWAILVHWWDYHGVPAAHWQGYHNPMFKPSASSYSADYDMFGLLHEYCDVICNPFGDDGATEPSDMIEGGPAWFWVPKIANVMSYQYSWAWNIWDTDWTEPAHRVRTAIKNGRPAVFGIGWLWHYGVAYGYRVREFKTTEGGPATLVQRRFKVNEGWGMSNGAWYEAKTYLGASIKAKQLINAP